MKTLSKSKYLSFCQCKKALWLNVNKPNESVVDDSVQARFSVGTEVGKLARTLFPNAVDVTTKVGEKLDISAMIQKTSEAISNGTEAICEASFSCLEKGLHHYCAVDILKHNGNSWDIYEVKSISSAESDIIENPEKFNKYAKDIAYQKWVLEKCGVSVKGTYLVTLNKKYVREDNLDVKQLFCILNLAEKVDNEIQKVPNALPKIAEVLDGTEPIVEVGAQCHKPYGCAFWKYCTTSSGIDTESKNSIFKLYRLGTANSIEKYFDGVKTFENIKDIKLTTVQRIQVDCTLNNKECINKDGVYEFLNKIKYPLYFLDFETMQDAIPQYKGAKPYQQITFQYSLHYIEKEGGELKHKGYLAPSDGSDPRKDLAKELCNDIPLNACIMAYNDPFEKGRIKEMSDIFPELSDHLMNIHDNIIDLLIPFRQGNYYNPAMGGSFSIKSVLPALFPDDSELNYHNLDELVQNGGDAMTIFPTIKDMDATSAEQARNALLAYCRLDTLAMVRIWEKLKEVVEKE